MSKKEAINGVSNDAAFEVAHGEPYFVRVTVVGTASFLFHAWSVDAVAEKAAAAKGSKSKKTDNLESYVFRNEAKELCIPGEYFRQSVINAAKFKQDPRSPRKSAMDLMKAALVVTSELCTLGTPDWDLIDRRRVSVQRAGITRERPAMRAGWTAELDLMVLLPEYCAPAFLHELLTNAGKLVGVGDFRPTFGRFRVTKFEPLLKDIEEAAQ